MKRGFLKSSKAQARPLGPVPALQPARINFVDHLLIGDEAQVDVARFMDTDPSGGSVPLVHPTTTTFRMAAMPSKGIGLFATRKLKAGDLIFTERPLIVGPRSVSATLSGSFRLEQQLQHSLNTLEEYLKVSVSHMRADSRETFMALANSHKKDGSGPIVGIMRTNAVPLNGLRPGVAPTTLYGAVLKDFSRLNDRTQLLAESSVRFDMLSLSFQAYAVRDVAKDEELSYTYTPVLKCGPPNAERNKELKPYVFVCACAACADVAASDARRAALAEFCPVVTDWAIDPELADDWFLNKCREHLDLITLEGVEQLSLNFGVVKALMEAHICLGDAQGATSEWAAKLATF